MNVVVGRRGARRSSTNAALVERFGDDALDIDYVGAAFVEQAVASALVEIGADTLRSSPGLRFAPRTPLSSRRWLSSGMRALIGSRGTFWRLLPESEPTADMRPLSHPLRSALD